MSTIRHTLLALLTLTTMSSISLANGDHDAETHSAAEFTETLPPIGYVTFCAANKTECNGYGLIEAFRPNTLELTPALWTTLQKINTSVNIAVKPVSDDELYGKPEHWTYPTSAGDCEDYLLQKKRLLEQAGLPATALRITVALDENGQGHAVLTVTTNDGDYILDNRRDDIRLWTETGYTFLKRQSGHNPKHWVALAGNSAVKASAVSSPSP